MAEEPNQSGEVKKATRASNASPLDGASYPLFTFKGINVSVHWMWFLAAAWWVFRTKDGYLSILFPIAECLTAFGIVILHEFGHALACRQTGGKSNHITLWLLGGIAFVQPPPRPGAVLWSIAAGPLVNVVLLPVTWGFYYMGVQLGWMAQGPDVMHFLLNVAKLNTGLLFFNMLPIYPLDGGQIMQSLLWFVIGRAWSMIVACAVGVMVGAGAIGYVLYTYLGVSQGGGGALFYMALMGAFTVRQSWAGMQHGLALRRLGKYPRNRAMTCPACGEASLEGQRCVCGDCGAEFAPFHGPLMCPQCGKTGEKIACLFCGTVSEIVLWDKARYPKTPVV